MGIDLGTKKLSVAIILTTLAICAFLLARGMTSIAAAKLFPLAPAKPAASSKSGRVAELPGSRPPDITELLKRNIFDSKTGPLWPPPVQAPDPALTEAPEEEFIPDPNAPPPLCEGSLKLVASIYSEQLPEWSFATIGSGSGAPLLYRVGGTVEGNQILAVYPNAVFLRPSGSRPCSLALFSSGVAPTSRPPLVSTGASPPVLPETVPTAAVGPEGFSQQELERGIKRVSDTEFSIARDLVDKALQNQAALMRSARIVPHEVDGKVVGVKLYGIRRNSLLGQMGLQNGDLMRAINGYDMNSPDRALEAYAKLRSAESLTVALQRRGSALNINYHIR